MGKKTTLSEFEPPAPSVRLVEDDRPSRRAGNAAKTDRDGTGRANDVALKLKSFRLPADLVKRLAMLKAETGRTEQDLAAEAFTLLFEKMES